MSARTYVRHLDLLTIPVWSDLHGRFWMTSAQQYQLLCAVRSGRRFTLRGLMAEFGYSRAGLADALQSLVTGGLLAVQTRLGRHGWTFAKLRKGVAVTIAASTTPAVPTNVRYLGTSLRRVTRNVLVKTDRSSNPLKEARTLIADISATGPSGPSGEGCMATLMAAYGFTPWWRQ